MISAARCRGVLRAVALPTASACSALALLASAACAHRAMPGALQPGRVASDLRGVAAVSGQVVWASGTGGVVLRSVDAGGTFSSGVVAKGLDLRSLVAFDERRALVLSAGTPARLLRTEDGGGSWREVFHDERPGIFFDSLAFAEDQRHGLAVGDPIDGRFVLLASEDAGESWRLREGPQALPGEGAFAASNSCLALRGGTVWLATSARVLRSRDSGMSWEALPISPPVTSASSGFFSLTFRDARHGAVTGGDYQEPDAEGFLATTDDGGTTWTMRKPPPGYRSSVAFAGEALLVAGTSGADVSSDGGASWTTVAAGPLNALSIDGATGWAVGPNGRIGHLDASGKSGYSLRAVGRAP